MQQKNILKSLTKKHRSENRYTLPNYFQLKTFKKLAEERNVKQTPYPLGCNTFFFFYSENTKKWREELQQKAGKKFYEKNGLNKTIRDHEKAYQEFNSYFESLEDFLLKLEKSETAVITENILTEVLQEELEKNNYFNHKPFELLKYINPPSIKATDDKIKASKLIDEKEIGKRYGWLDAKTLLRKGELEAGKRIKKMLEETDIQMLIKNKKRNEEFIKNYEASKEIKIFAENARKLNYLSCSAHKYVLSGRAKAKKLLIKKAPKKGINPEDFLYLLPWEFDNPNKNKIKRRRNKEHIILLNEKEEINEYE